MSDAAVTAPAAELRAGTKLKGRVALVTGGSRGIGAAICRSLASQRGIVAAGYSSNRDRAQQLLEELERGGVGPASITATSASPMTACASSKR
jgi:acetoacetyl-CoA reductase/3-oxoacyl-[acyl-carrier protein] reductase